MIAQNSFRNNFTGGNRKRGEQDEEGGTTAGSDSIHWDGKCMVP